MVGNLGCHCYFLKEATASYLISRKRKGAGLAQKIRPQTKNDQRNRGKVKARPGQSIHN